MQSKTFALHIPLILIFLSFLSSCGSPYLFSPAKVGSSDHIEFHDDSMGGMAGNATIELYKRGTESVLVGWEHFYDESDNRIHNHIYRGGVKFNVGLLSESPAKTVTRATLTYTIQAGANSSSKSFIESCEAKLLLAEDDWHGIPEVDAPDTISGDFYKDLYGGLLGKAISIDVTSAVKAWVADPKTNFGFVFTGSREEKGLIKNNDQCWTLLGDFALKVDYTRP